MDLRIVPVMRLFVVSSPVRCRIKKRRRPAALTQRLFQNGLEIL